MGTLSEIQENLEGSTKGAGAQERVANRDRTIVRTSIIGIVANAFLAAFKAVIGLMTHSIAITMDAVNNLSDAASSLITIIGTKLAGREPDREHPFGFGRVEYLSALVIAGIVLYAGLASLSESVQAIINPETPEYGAIPLLIIAVAVVVKIVLGLYVRKIGTRVNSDALSNSGTDALLDSVISASTLVAAFIYIFFGISLEAWLGAAISLVILKAGVDMIRETVSKLLGERADAELASSVRKAVESFPEVQGAFDLILNDFGPDTYHGSIHIEVPNTMSADDIDDLTRRITGKIYSDFHIVLSAVGIYSVNVTDSVIAEMRQKVYDLVLSVDHVIQVHGFYADPEAKDMRFDIVVSFDAKDRRETYHDVRQQVQQLYPDYKLHVALDTDFSEE